MKNFLLACTILIGLVFSLGCRQSQEPLPTPVPEDGFIRQSYDIQGLLFENDQARV
jgi:hypothetical protein